MFDDLLIIFLGSFILLWLITYVSYHCYTSNLKEKISSLESKITNIERDALLSLISLAKEKEEDGRKNRELVDLLSRELTLLFKTSNEALSLGLTHTNRTIRIMAEKAIAERKNDE